MGWGELGCILFLDPMTEIDHDYYYHNYYDYDYDYDAYLGAIWEGDSITI